MDAEIRKKRRDRSISRREERWSMDSQRFEAILTEIRNGYNNIKKNFDQAKVAEILEEILTEYAVVALRGHETPKFTELAVLLQHCSELYGKKVDFLYQHVLDICESVAAAAPAQGGGETGEGAEEGGARRQRRRASLPHADFTHIDVQPCAASRRAVEPPRPPPTLPRMYVELEPRVLEPHEHALRDYDAEPLGLPADYYAGCRLHDGFLVDELSAAASTGGGARPLSLLELQAAIEAAAPAPLSPRAPAGASTPLPPEPPPLPDTPDSGVFDETFDASAAALALVAPPPADRRTRKRRGSPAPDAGALRPRLELTPALRGYLRTLREYTVAHGWVARLVGRRADLVREARRRPRPPLAFRGWDGAAEDAGGFPGWSAAEASEAADATHDMSRTLLPADSDDDGFFERSSFSGSDSSRRETGEEAPPAAPPEAPAPAAAPRAAPIVSAEAAAWSAGVVARALAAEARGGAGDARAQGARVLAALHAQCPLPFDSLLELQATGHADVSQLLLASLVLATSGEIEIERGPPLSVNTFSMRLTSATSDPGREEAGPPPAGDDEPPPAGEEEAGPPRSESSADC